MTCVAFLLFYIDDDNLTAGLKPLRDAVAESLGVDDGDPRVEWETEQVQTRASEFVLVRVESF